MIKKILLLSSVVLLCAAMHVNSNSAPASTTGAPGEVDCTTSGCHESYKVNSGSGKISARIENGLNSYIPGKTYSVTVEVEQASLLRFGFQMVALKDKDNSNVGVFTPTDGSRNQVTPGYGNFSDRKYITYTFKSTSALLVGKSTWTFNWTAPETDEGPITFYVAGIAANNDGNDLGDYGYTSLLKLNPSTQQIKGNDFRIDVFPNPTKDMATINYSVNEISKVKIDLVDLQGRVVEKMFDAIQNEGYYKFSLPFFDLHKGGTYFIRFSLNDKYTYKKVIITD